MNNLIPRQVAVWVIACGVAFICAMAAAGDWTGFRGSRGDGIAANETVPLKWDAKTNVLWKIPMPQPGNGSAIVAAGRVLVTSSEDNRGLGRTLYCFNAASGEKLWSRTVKIGRKMPTHKTNPYCGTTPASDGKFVVVWHGSAGLHCYDIDGKEQWTLDLGEFKHTWGYGTSPVIDGGRVILNTGPGKAPFVAAYDLKTGRQLWKNLEARQGKSNRTNGSLMHGSWSTPIITSVGGEKRLIVSMPTRVMALSPETGKEIWTCGGLNHDKGDLVYSSPIIAGDICFVTGGYYGTSMAIRLGGKGDVTKTHRLWRKERSPQNISTGQYLDTRIYRANVDPKTIQCIDPKTYKIIWTSKSDNQEHWGSMVRVGEHMMVTDREGTTIVFKPSPKGFQPVSKNPLNDTCSATPAIANGRIYIRTYKHLYCIGKK